MKKEITLRLIETIGEAKVEVEATKSEKGICVQVYFRLADGGNSCTFYDFKPDHLCIMAIFLSKAYEEVKKLEDAKDNASQAD